MGNLLIDGTGLKTFGVEVSGTGTFKTPYRDVSVLEIPGRNGSMIRDNGRFGNVEITYPCYISRDFPTRFSNVRNFLLSKRGYRKITDSYDTTHYRKGYFAASIEPQTAAANKSASFDLTFSCLPQRFRNDGDTAMTIGSYSGETHASFAFNRYEVLNYSDLPQHVKNAAENVKTKYIHFTFASSVSASRITIENHIGSDCLMVCGSTSAGTVIAQCGIYDSTSVSFTDVYCDYSPAAELWLDNKLARTMGTVAAGLNNVTVNECKPLYKYNFSSSQQVLNVGSLFTINAGAVSVARIMSHYAGCSGDGESFDAIYIDADTMNAYAVSSYGRTINLNGFVSIDGDISLQPGENVFKYVNGPVSSGNVVDVFPRWYDL